MAERRQVKSKIENLRRINALCEIGRHACALKRLRDMDVSALPITEYPNVFELELECCEVLGEQFAFDLRWRAAYDSTPMVKNQDRGVMLALGSLTRLRACGRYADARPLLVYVFNRSSLDADAIVHVLQEALEWPAGERPAAQAAWIKHAHHLATWYGQSFNDSLPFWAEVEALVPRVLTHVQTLLGTLFQVYGPKLRVGDATERQRLRMHRAGRKAHSPFARALLASLVA